MSEDRYPIVLIGSYMMPNDREITANNGQEFWEAFKRLMDLSPTSEVTVRGPDYIAYVEGKQV